MAEEDVVRLVISSTDDCDINLLENGYLQINFSSQLTHSKITDFTNSNGIKFPDLTCKKCEKDCVCSQNEKEKAISANYYICQECNQGFSVDQDFYKHVCENQEVETLDKNSNSSLCPFCGKRLSSRGNLKVHMKRHTKEREFVCPICQKGLSSKGNLKTHMMNHTGLKPFICDKCPQSFIQKFMLEEHQTKVHANERPYECSICTSKFAGPRSLQTHIHNVHLKESKFLCPTCGKKYKGSFELKNHLKIHEGIRHYSCDICPKKFFTNKLLKLHLKTHTGVRNHCCDHCGLRFTRPYSLKLHIQHKTGDGLHECPQCFTQFFLSCGLKRHCLEEHSAYKSYHPYIHQNPNTRNYIKHEEEISTYANYSHR